MLAVLFPLFLGSYWSAGDPGPAVTSRLSWTTAIASVIVCIIAPVIGAIADSGGIRKLLLFVFAAFGAVSTAALSERAPGPLGGATKSELGGMRLPIW